METTRAYAYNNDRSRMEEEIRFMESRLEEMGFEGDCAYERAMTRFYQQEIASRRASIAGLGESIR